MVQSAPPDRFVPRAFTYAYPLPLDADVPVARLAVFDVEQRRQRPVLSRPVEMLYYGGPRLEWSADGRTVLDGRISHAGP